MIEKVVTYAIQKVVEDEIDGSIFMAALLGMALDTAAFRAMGFPTNGALVAGAATGAGHNVYRRFKGKRAE